jgi:hypothetical protein
MTMSFYKHNDPGTVTGLVSVTHVLFLGRRKQDVDGRAKPGQGDLFAPSMSAATTVRMP